MTIFITHMTDLLRIQNYFCKLERKILNLNFSLGSRMIPGRGIQGP